MGDRSSAIGDSLDWGFFDEANYHSFNYRGERIDTRFNSALTTSPNTPTAWDHPANTNLGGGPNTSDYPAPLSEISTSAYVDGWFVPPGHHWLPVSIVNSFMKFIDADARYWSYAYTSGKLNELHNWGSIYNGVSHAQYNRAVEIEMAKLVEKAQRESRKLTLAEIKQFTMNLENGRGANGKFNDVIASFNSGVRESRSNWIAGNPIRRGFRIERSDDYLINRGRGLSQSGHFKRFLLGAGGTALVLNVLGETNAIASELKDENSKLNGAISRIMDHNFWTVAGDSTGAQALLESWLAEKRLGGFLDYGKELTYKEAIRKGLELIERRILELEAGAYQGEVLPEIPAEEGEIDEPPPPSPKPEIQLSRTFEWFFFNEGWI